VFADNTRYVAHIPTEYSQTLLNSWMTENDKWKEWRHLRQNINIFFKVSEIPQKVAQQQKIESREDY
jgi:hypothetical protein